MGKKRRNNQNRPGKLTKAQYLRISTVMDMARYRPLVRIGIALRMVFGFSYRKRCSRMLIRMNEEEARIAKKILKLHNK